MPIDADGNRADVVMDAAAVISRMNLGRLYEHYFGAAARDVGKNIRNMLGITADKISKSILFKLNQQTLQQAYAYLLGFYEIVSEKQYLFYKDEVTEDEKIDHLYSVINNGVYIYYPIDNQKQIIKTIQQIEEKYKPLYGPVSYVGNSGQRVVTNNNIRIAPIYLMLLEKIADDWSSVATAKLQHFGVLSTMTKSEKFAYPYRCSPVRTIGETEGRIFAGYCGREAIAEMMDRSNSPMTQRNMVWNILDADLPSNMNDAVNREYIKLGGSKPLQLIRHIFLCAGLQAVYEPEEQ